MKVRQSSLLKISLAVLLAPVVGFMSLGVALSFHADPPVTGGVVAVLGGGGPERLSLGYEMARSSGVPYLLLIHPEPSAVKKIKEQSGVDRLEVFTDDRSLNSWDEAVRTRAWMKVHGVKRVLVVSDPPHMLRLGYAWSRVLSGSGLEFSLVSTRPTWWSAWRWWGNGESRRFVGNEVVKLAYYLWHY